MTTNEEVNFGSLVTSPSSFNLDFGRNKELPSLNCVDLFPNPPKYIDEQHDQSSKDKPFIVYNLDSNESLPKSVDNEPEIISDYIEDDNSNDSLGKFEKELETEKDHPEVTEEELEKIVEKAEEAENIIAERLDRSNSTLSSYPGPVNSVQENSNSRTSFHSEERREILVEEKNTQKSSLPATSPALSVSSYYSSTESVSSTSSSKKKKKKRHCYSCDIHFRHTHELFTHLKNHVSLPNVTVEKLSDHDIRVQQHLNQEKEVKESEEPGGLKLKLKLSGSQNFQVVPINKSPTEKSKKGIRILTAKEIKQSPPHVPQIPPIDAMVAMSEMPMKAVEELPLESRYFECPTLDGLDQYAEEVNSEAADDLLKKLLESGQQQHIPQDNDWNSNTNEFISIDRLAHMCTVCHCNFPDSLQLYEHKRVTGHDMNSMHPPPPPPSQMINQNNYRSRMGFHPGTIPGYPQPGPQMGMRPNYLHYPPQRFPPTMPPNYGQQPIIARRPPPLYRVPNPQNNNAANQAQFSDINSEMYTTNNGGIMTPPNFQGNSQIPQGIRQPIFLKTRLQRAVKPKTPHVQNSSPNGTPSPPIVMAPPTSVRPRFLGPPYTEPPVKKIKREPDNESEANPQPNRVDGLPVIQSVQGGVTPTPSVTQEVDKQKDQMQINEQVTLSVKNKDLNKNPKEVANLLANRGITVTHKSKQGSPRENSPKLNPTQDAVQKLQLNNSVSIISKKKSENSDDIAKALMKTADASFISCPFSDCDEKFLTIEGLNRHTHRGHKIPNNTCNINNNSSNNNINNNNTTNKVNLRAFRCRMCPAMFSTQEGLMDHQRKNHRMLKTSADELGIPIIDLRNEETKRKLAQLGIINYIPLSSKSTSGCFGFPIVSVQGAANPNVCNMVGMGVNALLSLGPIKPIPIRKSE